MTPESQWFEKFTGKFFSIFSRREVKTPLAFFFRVVTAVLAVVLPVLYVLRADPNQVFRVFIIAISVLIAFFVAVFIFAWFNPVNLVYGETGHRAERKFAMGTEQRELGAEEVATLEGQSNPALSNTVLPSGGGS
jgi:hypothetical protein